MIPIPQSVSAGCGLAWRIAPQEREAVVAAMEGDKIKWESIVAVELW